jgi:hypothetical protein
MTNDRKTREDIARQVQCLQMAYAHAGKTGEVKLVRDGRRWSLYFDGYTITSGSNTANELWTLLLDMRRAVEILDARS